MKLQHNNETKRLTITAETPTEVLQLFHHVNPYSKVSNDVAAVLNLADKIRSGTDTAIIGTDKRPAFLCQVCLDAKFTNPYFEQLKRMTGYNCNELHKEFLLQLTEKQQLCHTHHTIEAKIVNGEYVASVVVTSEPWNGLTVEQYAQQCCNRLAAEDIGFVHRNPEYIENGNGTARRNPDYLKRQPVNPGMNSEWLWNQLWSWWRSNKATPEQQRLLNEHDLTCAQHGAAYELRHSGSDCASLVDSGGFYYDTNYGQRMTWDEFAKL